MDIHIDARWEQGWWIGTTVDGEEHRERTLDRLLYAAEERYCGSASDIAVVLTVRYRSDPDWPLRSAGVSLADAMKVAEETPVDETSWIRELEEERARASNVADDPWERHESAGDHAHAARERAGQRLAEKRRLRAIHTAIEAGTPPHEIGTRFKLSARELSRITKHLQVRPEMADRSPEDVIWERAVGEISDDQMMAELRGWPYTFAVYPDEPLAAGMVRGSWDEVRDGYYDHLLTDPEMVQLAKRVRPPR